jgi:hypothetical protein
MAFIVILSGTNSSNPTSFTPHQKGHPFFLSVKPAFGVDLAFWPGLSH